MATASDILKIATAEIGTKESPENSNNVKYNTWYYGHAVSGSAWPWCMCFVQWVFAQAGMELPVKTASCTVLMNAAKSAGLWVTSDYKPGDVVIYDWGGDKKPDHTGILEAKISESSYYVIEGNTSVGNDSNGGAVMRRSRSKASILGAVRPKYAADTVTDVHYKATVTASSLNCRSDHSIYGTPVTSYPYGTVLTVTKECNGWAYVGDGWVSLEFLEKEDTMTSTEIIAALKADSNFGAAVLSALQAELDKGTVSAKIQSELEEAVSLGITDGSNPTRYVTRAQAAVMVKRGVDKV